MSLQNKSQDVQHPSLGMHAAACRGPSTRLPALCSEPAAAKCATTLHDITGRDLEALTANETG